MEAKIATKDGIPVVNISGRLVMEKTKPLHQVCLQEFRGKQVVFALDNLNFVGSSGIKIFLQIFTDLKLTQAQVKLVGLKADFQRFIQLLGSHLDFEIYETVDNAIYAIRHPESVAVLSKPIPAVLVCNEPAIGDSFEICAEGSIEKNIQFNTEISNPNKPLDETESI